MTTFLHNTRIGIIAAGLVILGSQASAQVACLNDVNNFNNAVCTAKDVRIAEIRNVTGPASCAEGSQIEIPEMEVVLVGTAKERYDIGIFVASDGGDAKMSMSGESDGCYHDLLDPGEYPDLDNDSCGDIRQREQQTKTLTDVSVLCQDTDDDGWLDIGTCLSWENNKRMVCDDVEDAIPGTPSKCRCEPIQVGFIPVEPKGSIKIFKSTPRDPNEDEFPFTITDDASGDTLAEQLITSDNAEDFILAENLDEGDYTVSEDPGFSYLDEVDCDGDDVEVDIGPDQKSAVIHLKEEQDAVCTFINIGGS